MLRSCIRSAPSTASLLQHLPILASWTLPLKGLPPSPIAPIKRPFERSATIFVSPSHCLVNSHPSTANAGYLGRFRIHSQGPIQPFVGAHLRTACAHIRTGPKGMESNPAMALKKVEEELAELGYYFNDSLEMRQVANDKPFEFSTQAHYEELGDTVADYIQELMVAKYDMRRELLPLPRRAASEEEEGEPNGVPIFVSKNVKEAGAVLILVSGSGAVMAGQWARKLCMNDSLHQGSVIPLLVWAQQRGIGTVVLNPNFKPPGRQRIPADIHVVQAWDHVISQLPAKHMAMVAHSYGGVCACRLLSVREEEVLPRLCCIAFTDSVHGTWGPDILSSAAKRFFVQNCVNWVQSEAPLDTVVEKEFLPKEDRETEALEMMVERPFRPKAERKTEPDSEPEPLSVYDEVLSEVEKEEEKKTGRSKPESGDSTASEGEAVTDADVSRAAAGLGFFEEGAVDVTMEEGEGASDPDKIGQVTDRSDIAPFSAQVENETDLGPKLAGEAGHAVVSKEGHADVSEGQSSDPDQVGQVLKLSDKAAMVAAIEKETDPGLKATLMKLAGEAGHADVSEGPSSSAGAPGDVSTAARIRGDVSRAARARADVSRAGGRGGGRGGKAKKPGFSWANLVKEKEHCRCLEVSAGVDEHERTTYSALESVKKFLEIMLVDAGVQLRMGGEVEMTEGREDSKVTE